MPYLNDKGYCRKCTEITAHRFSLTVTCNNCGLESTQEEYRQAEKEKKESDKKYHYFVSFAVEGSGFGNCEIFRNEPIKNVGDVMEMARAYEKHLGIKEKSLVIINFQLFN